MGCGRGTQEAVADQDSAFLTFHMPGSRSRAFRGLAQGVLTERRIQTAHERMPYIQHCRLSMKRLFFGIEDGLLELGRNAWNAQARVVDLYPQRAVRASLHAALVVAQAVFDETTNLLGTSHPPVRFSKPLGHIGDTDIGLPVKALALDPLDGLIVEQLVFQTCLELVCEEVAANPATASQDAQHGLLGCEERWAEPQVVAHPLQLANEVMHHILIRRVLAEKRAHIDQRRA